ncbi:MAG: tetratricopeptide repeat protein [Acidobacteriota bacterium]|nr:tetratricopeptide repeat protein [Acidobacteriota bacterium]MDH3524827.1 tetratricopeptide repeat protein [Acidobacteriota bacterium]
MKKYAALLPLALAFSPAPPVAAQTAADAPYRFALAKILIDEGEYAEAGENLRLAVAGAPEDPYLRVERAAFLLSAAEPAAAVAELETARRLAPADRLIVKTVGRLLLQAAREHEGAFAAAREAFEQLRTTEPRDEEVLATLGRIYLSEQRYGDAAAVFREALAYWPQNRSLRGSLIDALLRDGSTDEARQAIESFLEIDPTSLRARLTLFDLRRAAGDEAGALEMLRATPHESTGNPELFRRLAVALYEGGAFPEALYWLDRGLALEDSQDPRGVFLRALLLTAEGRSDEAIAELRALLVAEPERMDALQLLARHLLAASRWQEAADLMAPRLDGGLDPESAELALLHAEALRELDRGEEALDWLALAAAVPELRARALARQAGLLLRLQRGAEADEVLGELTAGGDREALLMAAEVCQREESYARSVPFLERVLAADDSELQALFWLGAAYERTGREAEAAIQFRRFLERQPDSPPVLNYLGYMWAESGTNLEEALSLVERAVALDPDNGAYIDSLGWTHYRLGNYEEARIHLERAADLVQEDAVVLEHLADVYVVLGRARDAADLYRRALGLGGDNAAEIEDKLRELGTP